MLLVACMRAAMFCYRRSQNKRAVHLAPFINQMRGHLRCRKLCATWDKVVGCPYKLPTWSVSLSHLAHTHASTSMHFFLRPHLAGRLSPGKQTLACPTVRILRHKPSKNTPSCQCLKTDFFPGPEISSRSAWRPCFRA